MWLYYWGMTDRQIEMLLADQPLVVYDHSDKGPKKPRKKGEMPEFGSVSLGDVKEAEARWAMKYGNGEKPHISLNLRAFGGEAETKVDVK